MTWPSRSAACLGSGNEVKRAFTGPNNATVKDGRHDGYGSKANQPLQYVSLVSVPMPQIVSAVRSITFRASLMTYLSPV
jgi:hypothetical protein